MWTVLSSKSACASVLSNLRATLSTINQWDSNILQISQQCRSQTRLHGWVGWSGATLYAYSKWLMLLLVAGLGVHGQVIRCVLYCSLSSIHVCIIRHVKGPINSSNFTPVKQGNLQFTWPLNFQLRNFISEVVN